MWVPIGLNLQEFGDQNPLKNAQITFIDPIFPPSLPCLRALGMARSSSGPAQSSLLQPGGEIPRPLGHIH